MKDFIKSLLFLATFFFLFGCGASAPIPGTPTQPPPPIVATVIESTSTPEIIPTPQIVEYYTFPQVSAALYGDAGNFAFQAGVLSTVSWVDAPPAADYYEFTLKLHKDKSLFVIGTDTDETDGISVEWLIPEHTSGALMATAYFSDGREVHSSVIDVYSYEAIPEGACILRSTTIVALSVFQQPSDTTEIIGVVYPNSMIEVVGANSNGWYEIKTDEVYTSNSTGPKVGPGRAWIYKDNTELFGACKNFSYE